jgi:hypothetical protein
MGADASRRESVVGFFYGCTSNAPTSQISPGNGVMVEAGAAALLPQLSNAQIRAQALGGLITVQLGPGIDACVLESAAAVFPTIP